MRIQAYGATAGSNFTGILTVYYSGVWFNSWVNMGANTFTCGAVYASGAVSCGGTLTYATNSISMTDGTGSFSVTPTMMRALYTYYATLGTTAVGTLTNYTLGGPPQHTNASGLYTNPLL